MIHNKISNELEKYQILQNLDLSKNKQSVYICSPFSAQTEQGFIKNMQNAREYTYFISKYMGYRAIAPHAWLPALLNDNIPEERSLALKIGLELLDKCSELFVCSDRISNGMKGEIKYALERGILIRVFDVNILNELRLIAKTVKLPHRFMYDKLNTELALLIKANTDSFERDEKCKCPFRR